MDTIVIPAGANLFSTSCTKEPAKMWTSPDDFALEAKSDLGRLQKNVPETGRSYRSAVRLLSETMIRHGNFVSVSHGVFLMLRDLLYRLSDMECHDFGTTAYHRYTGEVIAVFTHLGFNIEAKPTFDWVNKFWTIQIESLDERYKTARSYSQALNALLAFDLKFRNEHKDLFSVIDPVFFEEPVNDSYSPSKDEEKPAEAKKDTGLRIVYEQEPKNDGTVEKPLVVDESKKKETEPAVQEKGKGQKHIRRVTVKVSKRASEVPSSKD